MTLSSLVYLCLLPLTASQAVTTSLNLNQTDVMIQNTSQSTIADGTTQPRDTTSLLTTLSPITQEATPTNPQLAPTEALTAGRTSTGPATVVANSQTSNLPSSTETRETSSSQYTNKTTDLFPTPTEKTSPVSTSTKSTNLSAVTGGGATESTKGPNKTPKSTTKKPIIKVTKEKKHAKKGSNSGKVVAAIIGSALVLMMVGFLTIYIKKRHLHSQQISTADWAGPSPFLEGGADSGQEALRSSNRISLSSFLPQRMSKRLSLLPEAGEEMEEMTPGSTFGNKHPGSTFGQEEKEQGSEGKESNGRAGVTAEMKSSGGAAETVENLESSSMTIEPLTMNKNSEESKLHQNPPKDQTAPADGVENSTVQLNNGLGLP